MIHNRLPVRYPKGWFALASVYSFTALAILASTIFSLLLFLSIDDDPLMQTLFGGLAIIFELGKFYIWYEYGERRSRRDISGAIWSLLFYLVLAAISIGGSIGGINSATNTMLTIQAQHEKESARYDEQIASIQRQIELNEEAARKYIAIERISSGLPAMQEANTRLRQQQDELRRERNQRPISEQSSMLGLMSSLADGLGLSLSQVQFLLVCFLAVLLDVFGAYFVSLIGDETRFRRHWEVLQKHALQTEKEAKLQELERLEREALAAAPEPEPISTLELVRSALQSGSVRCTKGSVATALEISIDEVSHIFQTLVEEGVLAQRPNRHYYLS